MRSTKAIIGLIAVGILSLTLVVSGTFAFFSDRQSGTATLAAGTLDLQADGGEGVTGTINATYLKRSKIIGPTTITLRNAGTLAGPTLTIEFTNTDNDADPNPGLDKSKDDTAGVLQVTTLKYNGVDIKLNTLPGGEIPDWNSNTYLDLADLEHAGTIVKTGLASGQTKTFEIAVQVRSDVSNDFRGDGISTTIQFTLDQ